MKDKLKEKLLKGCGAPFPFGKSGFGLECGSNKDGLCSICKAKLQQHEETKKAERKKILEEIDDVGIELMFTDIKDKEGNKADLSDEMIQLISIWWEMKSKELKSKINNPKKEKKNER